MFGIFKKLNKKSIASRVSPHPSSSNNHLIEAVLISGVVLPPYPAVLEKIDQLLSHDDFSLRELTQLIEGDPSLTSSLMRVANSPVFGLSKSVFNVEQAFGILGMSRVQAILRSALLREAVSDYGNPVLLTQLWNRFNKIAEISTKLASYSPVLKSKADLAYMTGMFHATGSFILLKRYPLKAGHLIKLNGNFEQQMTHLNETLNTNHAMISSMVAKSWRLPVVVADAISKQREPLSVDGLTGILINVLHAAILLNDNKLVNEEFEPVVAFLTNQLGIEKFAIESLTLSA
ncbi:MAG: HDOD domain-containing protein [Methylophilaceae bacterium]